MKNNVISSHLSRVIGISLAIAISLAAVLGIYLTSRYHEDARVFQKKSGYFASNDTYVEYITREVVFPGVTIKDVTIDRGDNFWKIARKNDVDIDTLIGFNPFWDDLLARLHQHIAVPDRKGVVRFVYFLDDIDNLAKEYKISRKKLVVQKLPAFFKYTYRFKKELKPIAVFIPGVRPKEYDMQSKLAAQFNLREMFRSPLGGRFTSFFGMRVLFRKRGFHNGIDIAAPRGRLVGAARSGVVVATGWMGSYGKAVIIQHKDGYKTLYGHLSRILVRRGASVGAGRIIGRVGSTGFSTGPHLHFTLWHYGRLINPIKVLW